MKKLALLLLAAAMVYSSFGQKKDSLRLTLADVVMTEDSLRFNLQFKNVGDSTLLFFCPEQDDICSNAIAIYFCDEQGVQIPYDGHTYHPCGGIIGDVAAITVTACDLLCLKPQDSFVRHYYFEDKGFGARFRLCNIFG